VETLTGQTWEEFTCQEIFEPLGMTSSNFSVADSSQSGNVALPYRLEGGTPVNIPYANIDVVGPAGSINANLADMSRWVMLQLNQGQHEGRQIISPEGLAQIHTPTMPVPDDFFGPLGEYPDLRFESYGLGWFIQHYRGKRLIHHGGHIDGYAALISFMPEINAGVVFLANDNRTFYVLPLSLNIYDLLLGLEMEPWSSRVLEFLETMQAAPGAAVNEEQKPGAPFSHPLSDCVGRYCHPGYGELDVNLAENSLIITYNGQQIRLQHNQHDIFFGGYEEEGNPRWVRVQFLGNTDGYISAVNVPFEPAVPAIRFDKVIN
jgi:CubicO group peptidase (beta-lactamase class C family)